jgi:hypothetical protein
MNARITCPSEIADAISDYIISLDGQLAEFRQARESEAREIARYQEALQELEGRLDGLRTAAIESDAASAELGNAERRKQLLTARIAELQEATARAARPHFAEASGVVRLIYHHWRVELSSAISRALDPFGVAVNAVSICYSNSQAGRVLQMMVEFPAQFHEATDGNVATLYGYLNRALRGQLNLAFDEPDESAQTQPAENSAPAEVVADGEVAATAESVSSETAATSA